LLSNHKAFAIFSSFLKILLDIRFSLLVSIWLLAGFFECCFINLSEKQDPTLNRRKTVNIIYPVYVKKEEFLMKLKSFANLCVKKPLREIITGPIVAHCYDNWELQGSIPGLGKILDPWIWLNESFLWNDYLSRDWLLCRDLIRLIFKLIYSLLSIEKQVTLRRNFQSKMNYCKETLLSFFWFGFRIISSLTQALFIF